MQTAFSCLFLLLFSFFNFSVAEDQAELNKKIDEQFIKVQEIAKNNELVSEILKYTSVKHPEYDGLTNDKWKLLSVADIKVKALTKNNVAAKLKELTSSAMSEAFISDVNGNKIAFLSKTSSWNHKGKPKHDLPISGKTWKGKIELDESSGKNQIQVSVPIVSDGKVIASLVVGIEVSKL